MKPATLFFPLLLGAAVPAAHAHVDAVGSHGFVLTNTAVSTVSAPQLWEYLVNDVDQWWPGDHTWWEGTLTIDPQAGGCFCEKNDSNEALHMQVSYVQPPFLLRMTGGLGPLQQLGLHGTLNWQITPAEHGSHISLSYHVSGFYPQGFEKLADIVDKVQAGQLQALATYADRQQQ